MFLMHILRLVASTYGPFFFFPPLCICTPPSFVCLPLPPTRTHTHTPTPAPSPQHRPLLLGCQTTIFTHLRHRAAEPARQSSLLLDRDRENLDMQNFSATRQDLHSRISQGKANDCGLLLTFLSRKMSLGKRKF